MRARIPASRAAHATACPWLPALATLHLVQQPPELGVVGDGVLEMRLRTRGRDGEHLAREVAPPPRVQLAALLEKVPMRLDLLPQHVYVLAAHRLGEDDRRLPL